MPPTEARGWHRARLTLVVLAHLLFVAVMALAFFDYFFEMHKGKTWAGLAYFPAVLIFGFPLGWLEFAVTGLGWLGLIVNYALLWRLTLSMQKTGHRAADAEPLETTPDEGANDA